MKRMVFICFLFSGLAVHSQDTAAFHSLLHNVAELSLGDSLRIDTSPQEVKQLDSSSVKKWFSRLLPAGTSNRLKNRNYSLTGKITSHPNFNLLLIMEEKKRADSSQVQVVYLVSTRKDGTYISSLEVAVNGNKKRSLYNISSWLYKDYQVLQDSKITVNEKSYSDLSYYKINGGGRFILSHHQQ